MTACSRVPDSLQLAEMSSPVAGHLLCSAMSGSMRFEEALASRLTLMQVTSQKMEDFIQQHPPRLSPGKLGRQHAR